MAFNSFHDIAPKALKKAGIADNMLPVRALSLFKEMANELLGGQGEEWIRPIGVENNILEVACLNRRAAEMLWEHRKELAAGINAELGKKAIHYIKITR